MTHEDGDHHEGRGPIDSGRYDEAIALLEVVLADVPDDPVALYQLGSAHDSAGHEAEAVEPYRRALAGGLDPEMALAARIQLASTLRNVGQARESSKSSRPPSPGTPEYRAARMFLALALVSDNRPTEAVRILARPAPDEPWTARTLRALAAQLHR